MRQIHLFEAMAPQTEIIYDERALSVSVSGGRTSAYMAIWIHENLDLVAAHLGAKSVRPIYTFANTGLEHEATLEFLGALEREAGISITWVESMITQEHGAGTRHREVDFESAKRPGQWNDKDHPFRAMVQKYGIPNHRAKNCTRVLKLESIRSYMRDLGFAPKDYHTAIGIREDETRRVSKVAGINNIVYPLVDWAPMDKDDVIGFFAGKEWDLTIPGYLGNCLTCFEKSFANLAMVFKDMPEAFKCNTAMEAESGFAGPFHRKNPDAPPNTFFRGRIPAERLLANFKEGGIDPRSRARILEDSPCAETCEMFPMEFIED
jgi:3'-phosphoadenosine 5'-phosphosulfate sulfotransferase (PAPS reductase)/FAD synthetase